VDYVLVVMDPSKASIQARALALQAAQGSLLENHLLQSRVVSCTEHSTGTGGLSVVFHLDLENGAEAFLKAWGKRATPAGPQSYINTSACRLYGHHPDEIPLNEAAAWRLAQRLGAPVERVVAPCVLLDLADHGLHGSVSARRYGLSNTQRALTRSPPEAMAAAFFDSLIAQQDRHGGNYRWNEPKWETFVPHEVVRSLQKLTTAKPFRPVGLGLIDHGFCFARSGDYVRHDKRSVFVEWRHAAGRQALTDWERGSLQALAADATLLGATQFLEPDRASALWDRLVLMLKRDAILNAGEW
jgi:hypothetical protein